MHYISLGLHFVVFIALKLFLHFLESWDLIILFITCTRMLKFHAVLLNNLFPKFVLFDLIVHK